MNYTIGWNLSNTFLKGTDKSPLQIQIYHNGKQFRLGIKVYLTKADYQKITSGKFIRDMELAKIKRKIEESEQKAKTILDSLQVISKENFAALFFSEINISKPNSIRYLKDVFNETIEEYKKLNKSVVSYETALKSLTSFKSDAKLLDTTPSWIKEYRVWMVSKSRSIATANMYLRCLKVIWNIQIRKGLVHPKYYPFKDIKITSARRAKKALLPNDVSLLWAYEPQTKLEEKAKDYWFFCYFGSGMNPADALRLRYKNLKGGYLVFNRQKTKESNPNEIKVALIPQTVQILEKYASEERNPNDFLFPELRNLSPDVTQESAVNDTRNYLNKRLRRIGNKLKMAELPTLGNARHSFATKLLLDGNKAFATQMLGHTNPNTTEHYFASLPVESLRKITESLIPLPPVTE